MMQLEASAPFEGICLTDTFQLAEERLQNTLAYNIFRKNTARIENQQKAPLQVIFGNPPYSMQQTSANDNAQNQSYPKLEQRIRNTYNSASRKKTLNINMDAYVKAFRWASDRLDNGNGGVIAFVTNGGWLDSLSGDGIRRCFEKEFYKIYVFNLRGNARGSGEVWKKEGGKIFGSGSRTSVAVTILVKKPKARAQKAKIYYLDIGDYLSREEKLERIKKIGSIANWQKQILEPNEKGEWINQGDHIFDTLTPIADDKEAVFIEKSLGIVSSRDAWAYNFSRQRLHTNGGCKIHLKPQGYSKCIDSQCVTCNSVTLK